MNTLTRHGRNCRCAPCSSIGDWSFTPPVGKKTVNIIAGFLGAGKTTLVNDVLSQPFDKKIDIIVREYGIASIDDRLIDMDRERVHVFLGVSLHEDPQSMLMTYLQTLYDVSGRHPFDHLLIEASGAERAEGLVQLFMLPEIREHYQVGSCIVVVDGEFGDLNLEEYHVAREQTAYADVLVINKTDVADPQKLDRLEAMLREINPFAKVIRTQFGHVNLNEVLNADIYEQLRRLHETKESGMDEIQTITLTVDEPLDISKTNEWISGLFKENGLKLLRGKGFFNIAGSDYRYEFQSVRTSFHSKTDKLWGEDEERRTVIVLIGERLPDAGELKAGLLKCAAAGNE